MNVTTMTNAVRLEVRGRLRGGTEEPRVFGHGCLGFSKRKPKVTHKDLPLT